MPTSTPPLPAFDSVDLPILLVEDNRDAAELLTQLLDLEGYRVVWVTTASEALQIASRQPVLAVVSDFDLPGMNGIDFARQIRLSHPELKCLIAISGYSPLDLQARGAHECFSDCFQKPIDLEALLNRLAEARNGRNANP